ncbi:MAG: transcription termination/antitermination NusG family protein [Ruminiclostridium sp.]
MKVYCIFCKSGSEDVIADRIAKLSPELEAIIPVRTLQEKKKGTWISSKQHLIPGYIFLYGEEEIGFQQVKQVLDVYKILDYDVGSRQLVNNDYEYAMWIYRHCGNIDTSKVVLEGSLIRVVDGPLLDGVGTIVRIDRHKRRAWVEMDFSGKKHTVSLSIEDVTSYVA